MSNPNNGGEGEGERREGMRHIAQSIVRMETKQDAHAKEMREDWRDFRKENMEGHEKLHERISAKADAEDLKTLEQKTGKNSENIARLGVFGALAQTVIGAVMISFWNSKK